MPARERLTPERLSAAYERDARRLLVWLTRRSYDAQLATDLVGETFARAFAARARFRGGDDDELAAWLFGIARNALHEALRKGEAERRAMRRLGIERVVLTDNELLRIEDLAELGTLRAALIGALDELSQDQRDAVRLRVERELGYDAIAARLGISEQAARARVSRGLRVLTVALDAHDPGRAGR
jgi:RNA polymerase sigma-70 factor (ECF subfamily)